MNGPVVLGVRHSLPVQGVDLILGNDLAGDKVVANPHFSQIPCNEETLINASELFSACAVTQAMSRAASKQSTPDVSAVKGDPLKVWLAQFLMMRLQRF